MARRQGLAKGDKGTLEMLPVIRRNRVPPAVRTSIRCWSIRSAATRTRRRVLRAKCPAWRTSKQATQSNPIQSNPIQSSPVQSSPSQSAMCDSSSTTPRSEGQLRVRRPAPVVPYRRGSRQKSSLRRGQRPHQKWDRGNVGVGAEANGSGRGTRCKDGASRGFEKRQRMSERAANSGHEEEKKKESKHPAREGLVLLYTFSHPSQHAMRQKYAPLGMSARYPTGVQA